MPLWRTVQQGQRAAIWTRSGSCRTVDGPRRVFLYHKRLQVLPCYRASQNQYLRLSYLDGRVEHLRGPVALFKDPLLHDTIKEVDGISLTSHEVLVVYRPAPNQHSTGAAPPRRALEDEGTVEATGGKVPSPDYSLAGYTAKVDRTIIQGPVMHVPYPDEWTHKFVWHGTDKENKTRMIPRALRFEKLRVIPDQFYYNVRDCRTADDTQVVVKVMIFFTLKDLERMLDTTHDPIGDFINSVAADVVAFTANRTYEEFVQHTNLLNDIGTYEQLCTRAERMGYSINKVVYRGYHASDELQRMHDKAIQRRTQLRLESDTAAQEQEMADMVLERESQRTTKENEMKEARALHARKLENSQHDQALKHARAEAEEDLRKQRAANVEFSHRLEALRDHGVDLTAYLCAQYQHPDKVIQLKHGDGAAAPQPAMLLNVSTL